MDTKTVATPTLSVVMPCYNEEECIAEVVRGWAEEVRKHVEEFEIVVVNDGSRDQSGQILDDLSGQLLELRVIHQQNAGHGPALRHGFEESRGEFVFHVDSDNQFVASDFKKLWELRHEYDYLTGIRSHRRDALHRLVITRILRWIMYLYFGTAIRDSNTPFKLMSRVTLDKLLALIPSHVFAPSVFMTVSAAKLFRFKELPVTHMARSTGTVSIVRWRLLKVCWLSFRELAAFRPVLREAAGRTSTGSPSP